MRRVAIAALVFAGVLAGCSLFLDSGEFASGDDKPAAEAGTDVSTTSDAPTTDTASDAPSDVDASGDDFCTRSFAGAKLHTTFDLPIQTGWTRQYCEPYASLSQFAGEGNPAASLRVFADAAIKNDTFRVCWLESDVPLGRIYRLGFDVRIESQALLGLVSVMRLALDTPELSYALNLFHGFAPPHVGHRFGFPDGGRAFQDDEINANTTLGWASYRAELVINPGSKATYTLCRDGKKVSTGTTDYAFGIPSDGLFDIGLAYVGQDQTGPVDLRFDNVFLEVVP